MAEGTVRKRLARLRRDNVVQIGAWLDPLKIGYQIYAHIEIRVRLAAIERVAQAVARLPEVFFVGICTGAFDIFAAALFVSNQHMESVGDIKPVTGTSFLPPPREGRDASENDQAMERIARENGARVRVPMAEALRVLRPT